MFALRVELERPPTGDASRDAERLIEALRAGHVYTAIDGLAGPAVLDFTATSGVNRARPGDRLVIDGPVELQVRVNAPVGSTITLLSSGVPVARAAGGALTHRAAAGAGVFRVEVGWPRAPGTPPVPWIMSNPIYVGPPVAPEPGTRAPRPPVEAMPVLDLRRLTDWHIEHGPRSDGHIERAADPDAFECRWRFNLGPGPAAGQFAAFARPLRPSSAASFDRLSFRIRSANPMRISVQVRSSGSREGQRWQRSVYVDETPREISVFFDDMRPIGPTASDRPDLRRVDSLLFVVETTNARPGSAGEVWVRDVRLQSPDILR
ncbi:MAG: hypothetical protein IMZ44_16095 [Planctomycetes bacterium]|nr:hypothetical protein [Planctomycetota bacterium]